MFFQFSLLLFYILDFGSCAEGRGESLKSTLDTPNESTVDSSSSDIQKSRVTVIAASRRDRDSQALTSGAATWTVSEPSPASPSNSLLPFSAIDSDHISQSVAHDGLVPDLSAPVYLWLRGTGSNVRGFRFVGKTGGAALLISEKQESENGNQNSGIFSFLLSPPTFSLLWSSSWPQDFTDSIGSTLFTFEAPWMPGLVFVAGTKSKISVIDMSTSVPHVRSVIDLSFMIPPGGMGGSAVDVVTNVVVLTTPTGIIRVGLPSGNLITAGRVPEGFDVWCVAIIPDTRRIIVGLTRYGKGKSGALGIFDPKGQTFEGMIDLANGLNK